MLTSTSSGNRLQTIGVALVAFTALIGLLYAGRALCITLVISVIIAFILDPFVGFFMRMRLPRAVASFLVCTIALLGVYLLGLGAWIQLTEFADELPLYSQRVNDLVDTVAERLERVEQEAYRLIVPKRFQVKGEQAQPAPEPRRRRAAQRPDPNVPPPVQEVRIQQDRTPVVNYLFGYFSSLYNVLLMISFVPFLVYFMLSWRDHVRKSFLGLFEGGDRQVAGRSWQSIADLARAYVVGNFILGVVLAIASGICFWSWHLPYWIVVGVVSGFLSLVPYAGLPLAVIPPLLAALPVYLTVTPYLIIAATVAFFHLLALNLLYPALVGARVHLNPLAVTVALMFWGTLWGGVGLVLAIPITAGAKAVFDNVEELRQYGKLLGD